MLHDGKEFDVRVAHLLDVRNELVGHFGVSEPAAAGGASPGAEMQFVNGDGRVLPVESGAVAHPGAVGPLVAVEIDDDGAGFGTEFGGESVGIGFERHHFAGAREDFEFVEAAFGETGNENFPNAGGAFAHGMDAAIPLVEIADDADALRVGRPYGEVHAGDPGHFAKVCAELFVILEMSAFAEEVEIVVG